MAEYDADWDIESLDFLNLENMFLLPDDPMNIEEISSLSSDDYLGQHHIGFKPNIYLIVRLLFYSDVSTPTEDMSVCWSDADVTDHIIGEEGFRCVGPMPTSPTTSSGKKAFVSMSKLSTCEFNFLLVSALCE